MKYLHEEAGDAVYSEAHARELLAVQANYNKMLQELNNKLAKQKSDLAIKYMNMARAEKDAAVAKSIAGTAATGTVPAKTGTVTTAGQPVNAQGGTPTVESYPDILRIKEIDEAEERYTGNVGAHVGKRSNWYEKPEAQAGYEEPETPKKKARTPEVEKTMDDIRDDIDALRDEIQRHGEELGGPSFEGVEGEIENFFGEIGPEAAEVLNSGVFRTDEEKIEALEMVGVADPKGTLQNYYYYYPEFDPSLDGKRAEAEDEISRLQEKIVGLQDKLSKMEEEYNTYTSYRNPSHAKKKLRKMHEWRSTGTLNEDFGEYSDTELMQLIGHSHLAFEADPENMGAHRLYFSAMAEYRKRKEGKAEQSRSREKEMYPVSGDFKDLVPRLSRMHETSFDTSRADPNELQDLKDYMDAENISYSEDVSGDEIDFDETELDREWQNQVENMGFRERAADGILSVEDDEDEDAADVNKKIDEDKVFYVRVDDEGSSFVGKVYKLFDDGDWRSKLVDGESKTFEKLNFDPDWDEIDIVAFLRENYADAEIIGKDEFDGHAEHPEAEPEAAAESVHRIPTLGQFINEKTNVP